MTSSVLKLVTASLCLLDLAAPAWAGTTQDNLEACKAQLVLDGHADTDVDRVSFKASKRNRILLEVGTDGVERDITCRLSKGKVVALEEDGEVLSARATEIDAEL